MVKDNRLSYPRGGASAIPRAFCDAVVRYGGELRTRAPVVATRAQHDHRALARDAQGRRRGRRARGGGDDGPARSRRAAGRCAPFSERLCAARASAQEVLRGGAGKNRPAAKRERAGCIVGGWARDPRSIRGTSRSTTIARRSPISTPAACRGGAGLLPDPDELRRVAGAAGRAAPDGLRGGAVHRRQAPRRHATRTRATTSAFIDGLLGAMKALVPGASKRRSSSTPCRPRRWRRGSAKRAALRYRPGRRRRRWGAIARRCARPCPGSTCAATAPAAAASAPSSRAPAPWSASTRSPPTACYDPRQMPVPPKEFLGLIQEFIPFNKFLGITVDEAREGFVRLRLPYRAEFIGDASRPALHGGAISTLIDVAGGFCVWTQLAEHRGSCVDHRPARRLPGAGGTRAFSPRRPSCASAIASVSSTCAAGSHRRPRARLPPARPCTTSSVKRTHDERVCRAPPAADGADRPARGRHHRRQEAVASATATSSTASASPRDLWYLTGFAEPEALAVIAPGRAEKFTLFVRPRDPERETWTGRRAGVEGAKAQVRRRCSVPRRRARRRAARAARRRRRDPLRARRRRRARPARRCRRSRDLRAGRAARHARAARASSTCARRCTSCGSSRTPTGSASMRRAVEITRRGAHRGDARRARRRARVRDRGAHRLHVPQDAAATPATAPSSAAASTRPSCTTSRTTEPLTQGELLLIDAGCEIDGFTADVTRTFPIGARFSPAQRRCYELVLDVEKRVHRRRSSRAPPSTPSTSRPSSCSRAAWSSSGLLAGRRARAHRERARTSASTCTAPRTGSGMDVHDVGVYARRRQAAPARARHGAHRRARPLRRRRRRTTSPPSIAASASASRTTCSSPPTATRS